MSHFQSSLGKIAFKLFGAAPLLGNRPNNPLILMYHGVTADRRAKTNRFSKHVYYKDFKNQIAAIKRHFKIVSISTIVDGLMTNDDIGRCVGITFDDGFHNNYVFAGPILSDYGLTASFYVSTGYIGKSRWMWTDLVDSIINRTTRRSFIVPQIGLGRSVETFRQKQKATCDIKTALKKLSLEESERIVLELQDQLGVESLPPHDDYAFMDWGDVRELKESGFEVGAHSVNHPILSRIDGNDAEREIVDSVNEIKASIGNCSNVFCYPNGKIDDYSGEVMGICRKHFRAALSANVGYACASDLFELRRIGVSGGLKTENLLWWMTKHSIAVPEGSLA